MGYDICFPMTLTPRAKLEVIWRWAGGRGQKENMSAGCWDFGVILQIWRVPDIQSGRQLGEKRLLLPHSCHNSLFIPTSSGTAFKNILIDGIFCSVSSGRRGRRIYLLHRQFLWFEQDSPTPFKLSSVRQNTHAHLLPFALWPLGFLSL